MPESKEHKTTARRLARLLGVQSYNPDKNPDINVNGWFIVRVAMPGAIERTVRELQNGNTKAYIAVTNDKAIWPAIDAAQGTGVGVMSPMGDFLKSAEKPGSA